MIPVEQRGAYDCMTACLASIFECPYEAAPHLCSPNSGEKVEDGWWTVYEAWLAERGWIVVQRVREGDVQDWMWCPWSVNSFWIAGVKSPRIDGDHAVVMRGNRIVWDPHPRRDEKLHEGFTSCDIFLPLDPARFVLAPSSPDGAPESIEVWGQWCPRSDLVPPVADGAPPDDTAEAGDERSAFVSVEAAKRFVEHTREYVGWGDAHDSQIQVRERRLRAALGDALAWIERHYTEPARQATPVVDGMGAPEETQP